MDILILIDKLDDLLYNAKPIPMTDQVRVERKQVFDLLDQMRVTLPEEIKQARWIVKERREEQAPAHGDPRMDQIADSLEELKQANRSSPPPLTAAAAEQVRVIVEAAETSAAHVQESAEQEAKRIAAAAKRHEEETRRRTAAEAAARLGRAEKATDGMVGDAREVSAEIKQLLESLRGPADALNHVLNSGASSLKSDFQGIRARLAEVEGKPDAPEKPAPAAANGEVTTEFEALQGGEGYVSAERLNGAPALNRATARHLQEDQT